MRSILDRKETLLIITAILLFPLFFINVRESHDWGGDFAMYIMQAENIVNGISQGETNYIYNPDNTVLGPPAYPVGFPLILSPIYAIAGNSILAFTIWITAFLFGIGMLMAVYLRRYFNDLVSLFFLLILVYNPWTLNMKLEIMSEFPFAFLLLLSIWLFEKYSRGPFWIGILIAILGGLMMSIRMIGVVFPIAVFIWAVRKRFFEKDKTPLNKCVCGFLVSVGSVLIYLFLNEIIFSVPQAEGGSYLGIWGQEKLYATILYNLAYYTEQLKYFFSPWGGSWNFLPLMLKAAIFTLIILGMIKSFFRRLELLDMLVIVYLGIYLIYPYRHAGIRFLFPIIPFLLIYLVRGLELVRIYPGIKSTTKTWFLGSLVLVSYLNMFWYIVNNDHKTIPGPQDKASLEDFEYIRDNTAEDDVFVFAKPRVLALYAKRPSLKPGKESDYSQITETIRNFGVNYILVHDEISGESIKYFIKKEPQRCKQEWSNDKFVLYKLNY